MANIKPGPLHAKLKCTLNEGNKLSFRYQGNEILDIPAHDLPHGENDIEILIDKTVAEIFINKGNRYIIKQLMPKKK